MAKVNSTFSKDILRGIQLFIKMVSKMHKEELETLLAAVLIKHQTCQNWDVSNDVLRHLIIF